MIGTPEQDSTWSLPQYAGQYPVGTQLREIPIPSHDRIEVPYCPKLRTLKYRTYYPTIAHDAEHVEYPRWANESQIKGFASFAMLPGLTSLLNSSLSYLLSHVRIPAAADTPLLDPISPDGWPVVLFSHGLGGTDTSYSTICGNLASYGMVVFAIEHRDHSASSTIISEEGSDPEEITYVSPVNQSDPELARRAHYMLKLRNLELRLLLRHVTQVSDGSCGVQDMTNNLDLEKLSLMGHSFGAATWLHLLDSQNKSTVLDITSLNGEPMIVPKISIDFTLRAAILLDIWTQPLDPVLNAHGTPILHLISTQFSKWSPNHDRLLSLLASHKSGDLLDEETQVTRTEMEYVVVHESLHLSQSDGGVLYPTLIKYLSGYQRPGTAIMTENVERVLDFLARHGVLKSSDMTLKRSWDSISSDDVDVDVSRKDVGCDESRVEKGSEKSIATTLWRTLWGQQKSR